MIKIKSYSELEESLVSQLNSFIDTEFGHIPIVKEIEWATPDWTIIKSHSNKILTFYNLVVRNVTIDDRKCRIAGLNNVITPKEFRGNGHSTETLRETEYLIFDELKCEYGILLCADSLIPFYERLNWYKVSCPVYFKQFEETKLWKANTMMLSNNKIVHPEKINLNGLPW